MMCTPNAGFATLTATLKSNPSWSTSIEIEVIDNTFIKSGSYTWDDHFYVNDTGYITFNAPDNDFDIFDGIDCEYPKLFDVSTTDITYTDDEGIGTFRARFRTFENTTNETLWVTFLFSSSNSEREGEQTAGFAFIHIDSPHGLNEALSFAEDINGLCNNHSQSSWSTLGSNKPSDPDALDFLVNKSNYTCVNDIVTKANDTDHQLLSEAISKYDFMVLHYGYSDFLNRHPSNSQIQNKPNSTFIDQSGVIIAVTLIGVATLSCYIIYKKRKVADATKM